MPEKSHDGGRKVAETIHGRVGSGRSDLVAGWQKMLAGLLKQMAPYLSAGRLVTFRSLLPEEKTFFEALVRATTVPPQVTALYISPSVRHQMLHGQPHGNRAGGTPAMDAATTDAGILLACRKGDYGTIVNVLFAHPPHTPAMDIYENGQLIAGYSYASLETCQGEVSAVLERHLSGQPSID